VTLTTGVRRTTASAGPRLKHRRTRGIRAHSANSAHTERKR
jgi:hypothetical protein